MADVEHFNPLLPLKNAVDHTIDVRFVAKEQVPELALFRCRRAAIGQFFQTENGLFEAPVPFQRRIGLLGVDLLATSRSAREAMLTR